MKTEQLYKYVTLDVDHVAVTLHALEQYRQELEAQMIKRAEDLNAAYTHLEIRSVQSDLKLARTLHRQTREAIEQIKQSRIEKK
tara:strand:+ start:21756 stop:22007 length:252 start_codon:yes stop_codon:yes gene_type:complete